MQRIDKLKEMLAQLRDPEKGCQWCRQQNLKSISHYTIEEAYELMAAIDDGNLSEIEDELADLLFQLLFYCQIGEETGDFSLEIIAQRLIEKNIRRNPHVFGNQTLETLEDIAKQWQAIKQQEQQQKASNTSLFQAIPNALPPIEKSKKLLRQATQLGFEWPTIETAIDKLDSEVAELRHAVQQQQKVDIASEIGDMLFCCINIANRLDIDPEMALNACNKKFMQRLDYIDQQLDHDWSYSNLDEMIQLWDAAKKKEK